MKNNVVELKSLSQINFPTDLMTFQEIESKYKIKYATLYKYTKLLKQIPVYTKGGLRVSEKDIIMWLSDGYQPSKKD